MAQPDTAAVRSAARAFAKTHLAPARKTYMSLPDADWAARFRSLQPIYRAAVQAGLIKAQLPPPLGGTGGPLTDAAILAEEFYAVESSASLTILGTGLGLTPLVLAGDAQLHAKFLAPFLSGDGAPLASLVFSEPRGSANYADPAGPGLATVARAEGDEFVIAGEKIWATNCSGWDDRGADVQCVVCRVVVDDDDDDDESGECKGADVRGQVAIIMVTREDIANNAPDAFAVLEHPRTIGHTAVNGPHVRFAGLRVPKGNMLAPPGKGAEIVEMAFTASAALVGAISVGIMRQAFDKALTWAKSESRGSGSPMIQKQSVADLLVKMKTRLEASRALTWQAAGALGKTKFGAELCYEAKIFGSESAVECVNDAINMIGVYAYSESFGLDVLLQDAVLLPIFDGGNVGIRRRQIEKLFAVDDYDPLEASGAL